MRTRYLYFPRKATVELGEETLASSPGASEALVENEVTLISPGTELSRLHERDPDYPLPLRPGYSAIGRITAAGSSIAPFHEGDRVIYAGKHASAQLFEHGADHQWGRLYPCPEGLPPEKAVFASLAQIAFVGPQVAELVPAGTVAVYGLGLVGNLCAQLFQLCGMRVLALDPNAVRADKARACGLSEVITCAPNEQIEAVEAATDGQGADITVDAVGHTRIVETCVLSTRRFGQIILLGTPRVPVELNATKMFYRLHEWGQTMRGAHMFRFPAFDHPGHHQSAERLLREVFAYLVADRLKVEPLLTHLVEPARAQEVYDGLEHRQDEHLGVVFDWRR